MNDEGPERKSFNKTKEKKGEGKRTEKENRKGITCDTEIGII